MGPRPSGARAPGYSDHGCWAYSSRFERDDAAVEWLLDGARLGQKLVAVTADGDAGLGLLAAITESPDAELLRGVTYYRVDELYDMARPIDPRAQLAMYSAHVARAIVDGFNGLRVFCDATPLIADPARRASHVRWEHVADEWMAEGNPLAALCAYDIGVVGGQPQSVLAVHPLRHGPPAAAQFGLYWESGRRVLEGEIDTFAVPALADALTALPAGPVDIDARRLSFLCARAATTLARWGRGDGAPRLRLIGAPPIVRRVWKVLSLDTRMLPG